MFVMNHSNTCQICGKHRSTMSAKDKQHHDKHCAPQLKASAKKSNAPRKLTQNQNRYMANYMVSKDK